MIDSVSRLVSLGLCHAKPSPRVCLDTFSLLPLGEVCPKSWEVFLSSPLPRRPLPGPSLVRTKARGDAGVRAPPPLSPAGALINYHPSRCHVHYPTVIRVEVHPIPTALLPLCSVRPERSHLWSLCSDVWRRRNTYRVRLFWRAAPRTPELSICRIYPRIRSARGGRNLARGVGTSPDAPHDLFPGLPHRRKKTSGRLAPRYAVPFCPLRSHRSSSSSIASSSLSSSSSSSSTSSPSPISSRCCCCCCCCCCASS